MNYQYYAKTLTKRKQLVLTPYSGVFTTKRGAKEWLKDYKENTASTILTPRKLILAEAIEKKEVEPVNTVFYEVKECKKIKGIAETIHSIYYEKD